MPSKDLLNPADILSKISKPLRAEIESLQVLDTVDSTNRYAKSHFDNFGYAVCISEEQTAGKGRFGRSWQSPYGQNIYATIYRKYLGPLSQISGLSLVVSLALHQAITEITGLDAIQIKWPNDLCWQQQKLAGILVETHKIDPGQQALIIGFGVNVNSNTKIHPLSEKAHTSLYDITHQAVHRNALIAACLEQLEQYYQVFIHQGLSPFLAQWERYDMLRDQHITIFQGQNTIRGTARGINALGHLCLETQSGIVEVAIGEASLSP